jgi:DNA gyrase subunit A
MSEATTTLQRNINDEMRDSYLDYAMSVIVSRALPDARDGLKPVHRRILYAMHAMGSGPSAPYRKSARIVGEVLGKYHPHGDQAVYDAMVRMAQDFSMRYELIDGQGNFGSIDGDSAAAMRYTEARMATIGGRLLEDITKETVNFADNFDGTLQEPVVLPASIPNLLVNGASGIAVGMSTNIPPHNLNEVCDALDHMLDNWEALEDVGVHDLMQFIKGPDFPTGGLVYSRDKNGEDQLTAAYATGRGKLTMRAKAHLEDLGRGRQRIIITEIPYQINKGSLLERIVHLVHTGKIEGLSDMRDESDREGLRIVLELSRNAEVSEVLQSLFKYTPLESTFGVIMLALVDGQPRMLTLKQLLRIYIEHRLEIIRRRSEHDLANAEDRAHVLEGLLIALNSLDEIISTIRESESTDDARVNLMENFDLTERQASAILDMRLRRLAALERQKLQEDYDEVLALIRDLKALLSSQQLMRLEIKRELNAIRKDFGDHRSTSVVYDQPSDIGEVDLLLPREETYISFTQEGRLSRTYENDMPRFRKNAKDAPVHIIHGTTADVLYVFNSAGEASTIPVSQLSQAVNPNDGDSFHRLCGLNEDDHVVGILSLPPTLHDGYVLQATRGGEVKRSRIADLPGIRPEPFTVFNVPDDDQLIAVDVVFDDDEVMLITHQAQSITFSVDDVRPTGLSAGGVRGVRLKDDDDHVVSMGIIRPDAQVLVLTPDGRGKRSTLEEYPVQGRGGGGVRTLKAAKGQPNLLATGAVFTPEDILLLETTHGRVLTLDPFEAPETKRDYKGDMFFTLNMGERALTLRLVKPMVDITSLDEVELADVQDVEHDTKDGESG